MNFKLVTNFYFKCVSFTVQLAVFYQKNLENYYWIGGDKHSPDIAKWFGQTPRILKR